MDISAKNFFSASEQLAIMEAIKQAELNSSGEIRVHIENNMVGELMDRAAFLFKQLKMHQTNHRNGVLFYFAIKAKKFAVIGDAGINSIVEPDFWQCIKDEMANDFKNNRFSDGLIAGILKTGEQLKKYFPHEENDKNEISDDLSFS